ncbi:MAG: DegV family protein [Thermoleophilia bacterium]
MILNRDNTALVVDSTADLTPELRADPNVRMVPLGVHFAERSYSDWVDITPDEFYPLLRRADRLPTTSQPSAGAFAEAYAEISPRFEKIYSLHLSAKLSGTVQSASLAQEEAPKVTVLDTGLASVGIALLVDRLLSRLDEGIAEEDFLEYVEFYRREVGFLFIPATLEYLQKGGRIGRANRIAGSLLNIRPLLTITDGEVDLYKKARGEKKATAAIRDYFLERTGPDRPIFMAIAHGDAAGKARELEQTLKETGHPIEMRVRGRLGSVIGTYVGPDTLGLFFIQE